jgi:hypothetical protein
VRIAFKLLSSDARTLSSIGRPRRLAQFLAREEISIAAVVALQVIDMSSSGETPSDLSIQKRNTFGSLRV